VFSRDGDITLSLRGVTYTLGVRSGEVYTFEELYFEHVYDRVERYIPQPGWTVFDIGANVGIFAVQQAQYRAHVYAFEPNPECFRRLVRTVEANHLARYIDTHHCAVGASNGIGVMHVPNGWTALGSVTTISADDALTVPIEVKTIDQIVQDVGPSRIDLLKLDAEGAEGMILRGAKQSLDLIHRIVLEYHSADLLKECQTLLSAHGLVQRLQVEIDAKTGAGILYADRLG
jgi:FkbM family methyltransferase